MVTIQNYGDNESLQDAVARRLRGLLAEIRMSKTDFAARVGWDRGYLYRRLSGETPIDMHDLDDIEHNIGMRADYLVGGHEPKMAPRPPDNGGGGASGSRLGESNPRPIHYEEATIPHLPYLYAA